MKDRLMNGSINLDTGLMYARQGPRGNATEPRREYMAIYHDSCLYAFPCKMSGEPDLPRSALTRLASGLIMLPGSLSRAGG